MTPSEQIEFIKQHAMTMPLKRIAKQVGRSPCFVGNEMKRQGIVVPNEVRKAFRQSGLYRKGALPHNKGKKQTSYMTAEAIAKTKGTRFKKGRLPHNTREDYDLSLRGKDGYYYYYIRISLGNWTLCHRWIWEQYNDKIPKGHNIQFKDGDTLNFDISNLYMISRKDQSIINHNGGKMVPAELQETILLLNKLKKKINEK